MECRGIADQENPLRTTRTKERHFKRRQRMKRPKEGDRIADLDPSNNQEVETRELKANTRLSISKTIERTVPRNSPTGPDLSLY